MGKNVERKSKYVKAIKIPMIVTAIAVSFHTITTTCVAFSPCFYHSPAQRRYSLCVVASSNDWLDKEADEIVDIAIVGAGIGGLCAGAILNTLYGKKVGIYESHYLPGGCAHAFTTTTTKANGGLTFTFDSGPTIVLGCSTKPFNPLRQVLDAVGQSVDWIRYNGWGMIENKKNNELLRWKMELGPDIFERGPLAQFGGPCALKEFHDLQIATYPLVGGAIEIPAMAMRAGPTALIPLLRYIPALVGLIQQGTELTQGTFAPFMDGPNYVVTDPWLRSWLDAVAFSLSGLPASRTSAASMAYVLYDMHRDGAALDYPKGGLGQVIEALVRGVEQGDNGSKVNLSRHVESIDFSSNDGKNVEGLTLMGGKKVVAREGVICNAPVWSLKHLIKNPHAKAILNKFIPQTKERESRYSWSAVRNNKSYIPPRSPIEEDEEECLLFKCETAEMTGSFLHLHIAIKANGLNLDEMEAHYTFMDRSLAGDGSVINGVPDGPCSELNMIAVSNPCVLDRDLAPEGYIVIHAYGAANEPYEIWKDLNTNSLEYKQRKEERAEVLWRAIESVIPDVRDRAVCTLIGSPKTHERFLRRPMGTYGAATEDYLKDGCTPWDNFVLAGDSIFPGIGVPAVALSGASAANTLVNPMRQWITMDILMRKGLM